MLRITVYGNKPEEIAGGDIIKESLKIEGNVLSFKLKNGARRYFNGVPFEVYTDDPEEKKNANNKVTKS